MRHITTITVFWDDADPNNEGWAFRLSYNDGHEESGPIDEYEEETVSEMVVVIAWNYGIIITCNDVKTGNDGNADYAWWGE